MYLQVQPFDAAGAASSRGDCQSPAKCWFARALRIHGDIRSAAIPRWT